MIIYTLRWASDRRLKTSPPAQPQVEALAVSGDRIKALGDADEILALAVDEAGLLPEIEVLLTMVGGEIVYEKGE